MTQVLDARHQAHVAAQLQDRGVITAATVLKSSYYGAAGDVGGLTIDTITFRDEAGQIIVTTVSHLDTNEGERITGDLDVIYDPTNPSHVMVPAVLAEFTSTRRDLLVDVTAATLVFIASVLALGSSVQIYRRPSHRR